MTKIFLIFIAGLILTAGSSNCPLDKYHQSRIISDSISLSAQKSSSKHPNSITYQYQFSQSFYKKPKIALGLNELNSDESPRLDIKLDSLQVGEAGIELRANYHEHSSWKNMKLNFLATTRDDMELGTAEVLHPTYQNNIFEVRYSMPNIYNTSGLKAKPFLQGLSLESGDKQHIGIKHYSTMVKWNTVIFAFSNLQGLTLIQSVTISVVAFYIHTPGVLYADGTIEQNFVLSTTQIDIPKHGINQLRTYMVGILSFEVSAAQPISISTSIDEKFALKIGPIDRNQIDFIAVTYLIISVVDCGSCAGYPLLFDGLCSSACPLGTREKYGRCIPIDCVRGYVLHDGQCVPECAKNQLYLEGHCTCQQGYNLINNQCQKCPNGTTFNYKTLQCESLCGQYSIYHNHRCHCLQGYYVINNRCGTCPSGSQYSPVLRRCIGECSQNQVFVGGQCVCMEGFYKIGGKCGTCNNGTVYDESYKQCRCKQHYRWSYEENRCVHRYCQEREVFINGRCECQAPYLRIGTVCEVCPEGSHYNHYFNTCTCPFAHKFVKGQCVPDCPYMYYYDASSGKCLPYCSQYTEVWVNGKCECADGFVRDVHDHICYPSCGPFEVRVRGKCECIDGYYKGVLSPCQPIECPPGHRWNGQRRECESICSANEYFYQGECRCLQGYSRLWGSSECVPDCSGGAVRVDGVCKCPGGNKMINGSCTSCPQYTQYVNGVCLCYNGQLPYNGKCQKLSCGYQQIWDPLTGCCKCRKPLVWIMGRCQYVQACGINEYWTGKSCKCKYGFILKYGVCVNVEEKPPICPPNSIFNGVNCHCLTGFYPIHGQKCEKCPQGTIWNGKQCESNNACTEGYKWSTQDKKCIPDHPICGEYEEWDGVRCRCVQGTFWIQGRCQPCQYGTFFDGVSCTDHHIPQCKDPYQFWNGEKCACLEGYFELEDICVSCPPLTQWNGKCCKSKTNNYTSNLSPF